MALYGLTYKVAPFGSHKDSGCAVIGIFQIEVSGLLIYLTYKAAPFGLTKIVSGLLMKILIVSFRWQYGLTYKAVPFGLTNIVSGL